MLRVRNPDACCQTCPFWYVTQASADTEAEGQCRKQAPVYDFPTTRAGEWCGEHPAFFKVPEAPPAPIGPPKPITMGSKNKNRHG